MTRFQKTDKLSLDWVETQNIYITKDLTSIYRITGIFHPKCTIRNFLGMPSQEMSSCVAFLAGERRVPSSKFRCPRFDTCNEMLNLNWGRARVTESFHNHLRVAFEDDISKPQLPSKNCANLCSLCFGLSSNLLESTFSYLLPYYSIW